MKRSLLVPKRRSQLLLNSLMPKYSYRCSNCLITFETFHSIKKLLEDCDKCAVKEEKILGTLERIPSPILTIALKNNHGRLVKEYIRSTKEDVGEYKKELRSRELDVNDDK